MSSDERLSAAPVNVVSRSGTVPYIASWSLERTSHRSVVVEAAGGGVGYLDELPLDRDSRGVLWKRTPLNPGGGRPEFGRVHSARQRRVMSRLLCQICAGPADCSADGVLWILRDDRNDWPNWPESMAATHPPICLPCAEKSVRLCPHLTGRYVAVRVQAPQVAGVYGALYRPGYPVPRLVEDAIVAYDDPRVRWVVASQLVMELNGCTFVDLEAELAAGGR